MEQKLAVITEPYRVPATPDWISDKTDHPVAVARRVLTANSCSRTRSRICNSVMEQDRSRWGILVAQLVPFFEHFEKTLDRLREGTVRLPLYEVLVLGDFNTKATLWGTARTDARGDAVIEWVESANLILLNKGGVRTCITGRGLARRVHRRHRVGLSTSSTTSLTLKSNGGGGDVQ